MQAHSSSSIGSGIKPCVSPQVDEEIVPIVIIGHIIPIPFNPVIFQMVAVHHCYAHSQQRSQSHASDEGAFACSRARIGSSNTLSRHSQACHCPARKEEFQTCPANTACKTCGGRDSLSSRRSSHELSLILPFLIEPKWLLLVPAEMDM